MITKIDSLSGWVGASPRRLVGVAAAFGIVLFVVVYAPAPWSEAGIADASGGLGTLDLLISYSPEEGRDHLNALGAEGRDRYNGFQILDLAFPFALALFLSGAIRLGFGQNSHQGLILARLPYLGMAVDYVENIAIFIALRQYPDINDLVLGVANAATLAKVALVSLGWLLALVALVLAIRRRRTSDSRSSTPTQEETSA